MQLLVLVEKPPPNLAWFPFDLTLDETMKVEVHNTSPLSIKRFKRLLGKPHVGWCFKIGGRYNEEAARGALRDAQENKSPTIVGLDAAVKPWRDSLK